MADSVSEWLRHWGLRVVLYDVIERAWNARAQAPPVAIGGIDDKAKRAFESAWQWHPDRKVSWNRARAARQYRYKRFEFAAWSEKQLCVLSIGAISRAGEQLSVQFLERSPAPNALVGHVVDLAVLAAETFAAAYQADVVLFKQPLPYVQRVLETKHRYASVAPSSTVPYVVCVRRQP